MKVPGPGLPAGGVDPGAPPAGEGRMKVSELGLPRAAQRFLRSQGFEALYPPQRDSVAAGLLEGESVLVSAPTASGKTLIATMAILSHLSRSGGKAVYLSPLRALASEKYAEFKRMEKQVAWNRGVRVAISTGDFDRGGGGGSLRRSDVLVLTNERMDSLIRNGEGWVDEVGLVIADEVHLIGDPDRGPTLEMVLTRLARLDPSPQLVGLSATVTNSEEIAGWLGCRLVTSSWRPVPLREGVCDGYGVTMQGGGGFEVERSVMGVPADLGVQSVADGGQSLIFAETRTRAASLATKACKAVSGLLGGDDARALGRAADRILRDNENTEMVKRLAGLVRQGVAFHHAGLSQKCREAVESEFRGGRIKLISSTPTLAAGVNLPARRVVISTVNRYDPREGRNKPISVLEYKQLCGRAGRPQYDDHGEAITVARDAHDEVLDLYVNGEPEPIESKLVDHSALRIHLLSAIVTDPGMKEGGMLSFFLRTLGGRQSTKSELGHMIGEALGFLDEEGLVVEAGGRYAATEFGKKTSKLYLDPLTATYLKESLDLIPEGGGGAHTLGLLHAVSGCSEFFPQLGLRKDDYERADLLIDGGAAEMFRPVRAEDCNRSLLALHAWITESPELSLSDSLGVESGDMHRMVETAGRLLYCMREIAKEFGRADLLEELAVLRRRVAYGIRGELADLVTVRGLGRVRARALYRRGIRSRQELAGTPAAKLAGIDKIGPVLARRILAAAGARGAGARGAAG